jgi:ribonuclease P/MRP protein subunit POP5
LAKYKLMVKAGAMRKRYILFEYAGSDLPADSVKKGIYNEAMRFFGELGISYAGLKLMEYDEKTKLGILRCERSYLDKVLGFLALVNSIDRKDARLKTLKSSGTIAALKS